MPAPYLQGTLEIEAFEFYLGEIKLTMQDVRMLQSCQVSTSKALHDSTFPYCQFHSSSPFSYVFDAAMRDFFHFLKCSRFYPDSCLRALTMVMDNEDNEDAITCLEHYTQVLL